MCTNDNSDELDISRRNVIRSLGAAGTTTLFAGAAAGQTPDDRIQDADWNDIVEILRAQNTRTLLDEVGRIWLQPGDAKQATVSDDLTVYTIPTSVGDIFYGHRDDHTEVGIAFGRSLLQDGALNERKTVDDWSKRRLNSPYDDLDFVTAPIHVVDRKGRHVQSRATTADESQAIASTLDVDPKRVQPFVCSDRDDLLVFVDSADGPSTMSDGGIRHLSGLADDAAYTELSVDQITTLDVQSPDVSTQANCNDLLGACAKNSGASAGCIAGCVTAGVSTWGAAFALCGICTGLSGFQAGVKCGQWYKRCVA